MKKFIFIITTLLIGVVSCVSEEEFNEILNGENKVNDTDTKFDNIPVEAINDTLLHNGSDQVWTTSNFLIAGVSTHGACRLDDTMTLKSDGTYSFDGGGTSCGLEDNAGTVTGTWEVSEDKKSLIFNKQTANEYAALVVDQTENSIELVSNYRFRGVSLELRGEYKK